MFRFTSSYRSKRALFLLVAVAKMSVAQSQQAAPPSASTTPATPASPMVLKQVQSAAAMTASVDKQRNSIQTQIGIPAQPESFFTTAWTTPAAIPLPHLVASCSAMPDADLKPLLEENAKKQELKVELIRAVIRRESAFYPCAVSDRGALGLMQLMPEVADQFGVD